MKINSENAKRQRAIARRMKSGKPLVGLLAGIAVGAAMTGCESSDGALGGYFVGPVVPPAETNAVEEFGGPELMGELPPAPAETNAVNEAGDEVTAGLIIGGDIEIEETEVPES